MYQQLYIRIYFNNYALFIFFKMLSKIFFHCHSIEIGQCSYSIDKRNSQCNGKSIQRHSFNIKGVDSNITHLITECLSCELPLSSGIIFINRLKKKCLEGKLKNAFELISIQFDWDKKCVATNRLRKPFNQLH